MNTPDEEEIEFKELSPELLSNLKEAFSHIQKLQNPNTETVPKHKLELLLRITGLNPTREILYEMESLFTLGENLTYEEVLRAAKRVYRTEPTYSDLIEVAKAFDRDEDGYLTLAEIRKLLFNSGEILSEIDYEDILEECGGEYADKVRVEDFVRAAYNC